MKKDKIFTKSKDMVESLKSQGPIRKHLKELKDEHEDTYKHSLRVARLSVALGQMNDMDDSQLRILGCAGLLHDVGKLDVDSEILTKGGSLTEEEKQKIKNHPRLSFKRLSDDFFGEIRKIVVAHHEHQEDPYPREENRGASGSSVFLSQILAVADMFDALSTERSYKESLSIDEIERIMSEEFVGEESLVDQVLNIGSNLN